MPCLANPYLRVYCHFSQHHVSSLIHHNNFKNVENGHLLVLIQVFVVYDRSRESHLDFSMSFFVWYLFSLGILEYLLSSQYLSVTMYCRKNWLPVVIITAFSVSAILPGLEREHCEQLYSFCLCWDSLVLILRQFSRTFPWILGRIMI